MKVRRLESTDIFEAWRIQGICFHARLTDEEIEQKRQESLTSTSEIWGAYTHDDVMMGSIVNNHFTVRVSGQDVMAGGIGGVSTLPEYRESGAIRAIFGELLKAGRERGEVISMLYPFNHGFYRKFGYETATTGTCFEMKPEHLKAYRHAGWVRQWKNGEPVTAFTDIYNAWSQDYHLSCRRTDQDMADQHVSKKYMQDRRFCYLLGRDGEDMAFAYVVLDDVYNDPQAILNVREAAWLSAEGFRAVLGFLSRFGADYGMLRFCNLPTGIDVAAGCLDPYGAKTYPQRAYMVRVMNTQKLLEAFCRGRDAHFVLQVTGDDMLPPNNGIYRVNGDEVTQDDTLLPDIAMDMHALGRLLSGDAEPDSVFMRPDVTVQAGAKEVKKVFFRRRVYVGDHF